MIDPAATRRAFMTALLPREEASASCEERQAATTPGPEQSWTTLTRAAMGCLFAVFVDPRRFPGSLPAAADALELVGSLESELTVYSPASHLSEVNRRADREEVTVSANLAELLRVSLELFAATGGAFDVTAGPLSKVWGFHARRPAVPTAQQIARALECVGSHWLDFDPLRNAVQFRRPGLEINLASIGKGYALDQVARLFGERGISQYMLHGGQSSVLARGCQVGDEAADGWSIGLVHPVFPDQRIGTVRLRDGALGTSGCQRQSLVHAGKRLGHIIDPRTGWPTTHVLSATVLAPSAALADALATAFCVMSLDEVAAYCKWRPDLSALLTVPAEKTPSWPMLHGFNLQPKDWILEFDVSGLA
jgi:thiamine biosynthesis lipoprotein